MPEMFSYIFGSLRHSEEAIKKISKALKSQNRINKSLVLLGVTAVTCTIVVDMQYREQQKQIEALTKEIKELKGTQEGA